MGWRGPLPRHWLVVADVAVAVAVAVFAFSRAPVPSPVVGTAIVVVAVVLPLRRLAPATVLGVELAAAAAAVIVGVPGDPVVLAVAFALYPVALRAGRRRASVALGLSLASVVLPGVGVLLVSGPRDGDTVASGSITVVAYSTVVITSVWALGRLVRGRRADAEALVRMRERQAVAEERVRIARDVHDIVGHSLSLITMRAAVAEHLAADRPEEGRAALAMIEEVGRRALDDVRSALTTLREDTDGTPDLAGIDDLVGAAEAAGLSVEYRRSELPDVPATVQASAYRIVQEALTNARRHARPRRCSVAVGRDDSGLTISVVNPCEHRHDPAARGHGILGMTERAAQHGGVLRTGPTADGRFELLAVLPLATGPAR